MEVDVFDHDGRLLYTYPIEFIGLNYTPSEDEIIEETKKNVLADGLVEKKEIEKYTFSIREKNDEY